jgi:hypothetical protein
VGIRGVPCVCPRPPTGGGPKSTITPAPNDTHISREVERSTDDEGRTERAVQIRWQRPAEQSRHNDASASAHVVVRYLARRFLLR